MKPSLLALIINLLVAVAGALQAADWVDIVGSAHAGIVATVIAAVNAAVFAVWPSAKKPSG